MIGWPLVGRQDTLELLDAALAAEGVRGAVLTGPPGVGKTRLARELINQLAQAGWATVWVVGSRSMASIPFGAFAHVLAPSEGKALTPLEVLRGARDQLLRLAADRPLLIGVDDAHLLDDSSAGLVHLMATATNAFVLATVRRGEPAPDALRGLWKEGLAERVELEPLSRTDVGELLVAALGGQVDGYTKYRLWQVSGGNVLFIRELVRLGLERGALTERGGVWAWIGELVAGTRLAELVDERLEGLDAAQRAGLEVVALGEPLPLALAAAQVSSRVLTELEAKGLIVATVDGRRSGLRLSHPLYAETLRAGIGALRRREIYCQLADALQATGLRRRDDVLRLSTWRLDGGGRADPAAMLRAARRARATLDHGLMERLTRAVLWNGADLPAVTAREASILLGDALHWQGRHHEAKRLFDDLAHSEAEQLDPGLISEEAMVASSNLFWGMGDAAAAEVVLAAAEECLAPGPDRDCLLSHRASLILFNGRPAEALTMTRSVLESGRCSRLVRARTLALYILALALTGRAAEAATLAATSVAESQWLRQERPLLLAELVSAQVVSCWLAGRLDEMHRAAEDCYHQMIAAGAHDLRGLWALLLGKALLARGCVRSALERLREAAATLRELDHGGYLPWSLACLAQAYALLGNVEDAAKALGECESRRLAAVRLFDVEIGLAEAWLAAASGEFTSARRLASTAASEALVGGACATALLAMHDAVRLGELGLADTVSSLRNEMDGVFSELAGDHVAALAERDGDGLDACAEHFAAMGALLLAAEAAAEASEVHRRARRNGAHLRSRHRSVIWMWSCEGARSPQLRATTQAPLLERLTARELEVAELAARGLSKREIAARLVLSMRTVGNHLNHVYGKLGLSTRNELATLLALREQPRAEPT